MVLDRRMFRRPSQIAPNKGPSSKGIGITSGLTQPVKMETGGDVKEKYDEYINKLLPITEEMYPKQSFFERAGMSPFQFFAALGSPMAPGQTVLGKIGEAGQYLDIKPESTSARDLAGKIALEKALEEDEDELLTVGKEDRVLIKDPDSETGYREIISPVTDDDLDLEGLPEMVKIQKLYDAGLIDKTLYDRAMKNAEKGEKYVLSPDEIAESETFKTTLGLVEGDVKNAQDKINADATLAEENVGNFLQQKDLLTDSTTGLFSDTRTNIDKLFQLVGLDQAAPSAYSSFKTLFQIGDTSQTEALNALQALSTINLTTLLPSNLNETEVGLAISGTAQSLMTKEGQELILDSNIASNQIKALKGQLYDDFISTGILKDRDGTVLLDFTKDGDKGVLDVFEREQAINELDKYESTLINEFVESQRDRINGLSQYQPIMTQDQLADLDPNKKTTTINGTVYNFADEMAKGKFKFVGFSDENGNFTYDDTGIDPLSVKTLQPKRAIFALQYGDNDIALFDFKQ